jgi:hypothetical protein
MSAEPKAEKGPFRTYHVRPGDRYELSDGHPVYCAPSGGDGARGSVAGGQVLDTDPDVEQTGFDAGFTSDDEQLRAPDVAVGNVPDAPGWIRGAPALAVEYAGSGQDEAEVQKKIGELLQAGTRYLWVVRLIGPRRVEVHEAGQPMRTLGPGERLTAPGVLRNPVPVEALYDRTAAHEATLRNLLQRKGYAGLEGVLDEGRRAALLEQLEAKYGTLESDVVGRVQQASGEQLRHWAQRLLTAPELADVFAE